PDGSLDAAPPEIHAIAAPGAHRHLLYHVADLSFCAAPFERRCSGTPYWNRCLVFPVVMGLCGASAIGRHLEPEMVAQSVGQHCRFPAPPEQGVQLRRIRATVARVAAIRFRVADTGRSPSHFRDRSAVMVLEGERRRLAAYSDRGAGRTHDSR